MTCSILHSDFVPDPLLWQVYPSCLCKLCVNIIVLGDLDLPRNLDGAARISAHRVRASLCCSLPSYRCFHVWWSLSSILPVISGEKWGELASRCRDTGLEHWDGKACGNLAESQPHRVGVATLSLCL